MKYHTPAQFSFQDRYKYPQDNHIDFEWWLANNLQAHEVPHGWTYLPVTWTAYYKANGYGLRIEALQKFINGLPTNKKYFTICQYDDGILNDLTGLHVFKFNMGAVGDYQLPLICQPHGYKGTGKKDIFCSFVGRVTHPIREQIVQQLEGREGYYISTKPHTLAQFCDVLARSRYVLAPRGYGATSFRICEALQYGACPIYTSDVHLRPHNIDLIYSTVTDLGLIDNYKSLYPVLDNIYNKYFTYQANKDLIIKHLKQQA